MKFSLYNKIINEMKSYDYDDCCLEKLYKLYPDVAQATLDNIYAQIIQRRVRSSYPDLMQHENILNYYAYYCKAVESKESPGIILRLAKKMKSSPATIAKIILEHHLHVVAEKEGVKSNTSRSKINMLLRDTTLIQDKNLSYEVYLCLIQDDVYGPFADSMKHSIGHEYEFLLKRKLDEKDIKYKDENVLRKDGYDKTPDVKLEIPIAVNGHVINWIESKASFGDAEYHKEYLKNQFWSYWNRYGPGMVIYWFGFIDELDDRREKGIIVEDHMPEDIILMDPLSKSGDIK